MVLWVGLQVETAFKHLRRFFHAVISFEPHVLQAKQSQAADGCSDSNKVQHCSSIPYIVFQYWLRASTYIDITVHLDMAISVEIPLVVDATRISNGDGCCASRLL
jgi:predicted transcriptional regulator